MSGDFAIYCLHMGSNCSNPREYVFPYSESSFNTLTKIREKFIIIDFFKNGFGEYDLNTIVMLEIRPQFERYQLGKTLKNLQLIWGTLHPPLWKQRHKK